MQYYVYKLVTNNQTFYIGITNNPERRKSEHVRGGINPMSTELKYKFISALNDLNQSWELVVVSTHTDNNENYEDFEIFKCLQDNVELTNMMKGSIYEEATTHMLKDRNRYLDSADFFKERQRHQLRIDDRKNRAKRAKKSRRTTNQDTITNTIFIEDMEKPPKPSSGLQAILNKKYKYK